MPAISLVSGTRSAGLAKVRATVCPLKLNLQDKEQKSALILRILSQQRQQVLINALRGQIHISTPAPYTERFAVSGVLGTLKLLEFLA
jgi:hypothetical protein